MIAMLTVIGASSQLIFMSVFARTGCLDVPACVHRGNNSEDSLYGGKDVDMNAVERMMRDFLCCSTTVA